MKVESGLSEKAYEIIKENLATYEKGKYLSARAFSSEIGMSYTPVREAFLRLQREGFIKRVPNVGFFVVHLEVKDVVEIFQVRECLEKFVFEAVFNLISNNDIQALAELIEKQRIALDKGDIRQYIKADDQFHFTFFTLYNNKHFNDLIKNVREQYMFCSNKVAKLNSADGVSEHIQILNEIKAGNKEQAVKYLMAHIENAKQRMKDGFINVWDI